MMQHDRGEPLRAVEYVEGRDDPDVRVVQRLLDPSSGARHCSVSYIRTPPGGGSPEGLHTHEVDQLFYILSGVMSVEVDGDFYEAGPNTLVIFPARVPHRNWNDGSTPTVHVAINAPVPDPDEPFATQVRHEGDSA